MEKLKKTIALLFGMIFLIQVCIATETGHEKPVITNKTCPVMKGNPVKKELFVDYKGKRVYLCCAFCKKKFSETPEKYLKDLPQFNVHDEKSTPGHEKQSEGNHEHSTGGDFSLHLLVMPFGVLTFIFLMLTLLSGLFMRKNRKLLFPWHKRFAFSTVTVAICHVLLVIFS